MPIFSFLNPAFLWALPAAAIPIVIHLLSRRRLPEVSFRRRSSFATSSRRKSAGCRLREILLLILRTLAILLLVLAFARPSLTPHNTVAHSAAAVVILIDDSESMAALEDEARPRIDAAKERASAILKRPRPGDEISIATSHPIRRPQRGTHDRPGPPRAGPSADRGDLAARADAGCARRGPPRAPAKPPSGESST